MKKTFITCLALLAISLCLFVSCSAENTAVNEMNDVAYVTFGRDSRDFSASYEVQSYDDLYWFYTAKKADNYGTTGATTGAAVNKDGETINKGVGTKTVGPFSQGKWTFTLSAYADLNEDKTPKTETCVYKSEEISVTLNGGETKAIPVTVLPAGDKGTIQFKDAYFQYKDGGKEASKFMIRAVGNKGTTYVLSNDPDYTTVGEREQKIDITLTKDGDNYNLLFLNDNGSTSDSIVTPVGYYTCTAYAYLDSYTSPMATSTFGLGVYGNVTTVVSGSLLENPDSKVSFYVAASDIKTFSGNNENKTVEVNVAPVSGNSTIVDFSKAKNIYNNATYAVNVEALSANAANDAFQISNITEKGKETLGSVKLSLTQIEDGEAKDVKEFGSGTDEYVTVSTYIGTGLTGDISVVYNGTGDDPVFNGEGLGYNSETGFITFKTNHFSEFFIVRDGNVKNENQKRYYYSLQQAITNAYTNDSLKLLKDIEMTKEDSSVVYTVVNNGKTEERYGLLLDKDVSIDLNEQTLTLYDRAYVSEKGNIIISNGKIKSSNRGFVVEGGSLELCKINLTTDQKWGDAIFISEHSKNGTVTINNSTINAYDYAISTNASAPNVSENITIIINNSTISAGEIENNRYEDATGLLFNVQGNVQITDSEISGTRQGVILRGGNTVISNSTISSGSYTDYKNDGIKETDYTKNNWLTGNAVPLAALVIGNRTPNSYKYPTTVTLDNVTLKTGEKAVRKAMYVYQESDDYPVTVLGSLSTDSERTINVIDGKENKAIVFPEAKIGDKYYNKFADAVLAAQQATNEDNKVVDVLKDKITVGTHSIEINGSVIINGNGADFYQVDGEQDVSVFTYNNNKGVVSKEQNVNIIINNAKNLRVWGNGSLIADNQKVKISLNNCSWDLSSKGFENVDNIGMIMLRGANENGSYQLEMENCQIKNTEKTDAIHGNIFSKVLINNCTFGNTARPINISHDLESDCTVTITGCTFTNCGEEGMNPNTNYSAPIRIVNKNENGSLKANIGNVTIDSTKSRDQMGDVLLCDCRNEKEYYALTAYFSGCSELKVRNSSNNLITIERGTNQDVLVSNQ